MKYKNNKQIQKLLTQHQVTEDILLAIANHMFKKPHDLNALTSAITNGFFSLNKKPTAKTNQFVFELLTILKELN